MWFSTLTLAGLLSCQFNGERVPPAGKEVPDGSETMGDQMDLEKLVGRWVHAHEEDDGDRVVYRASGYAFPPSRGRDAFTLDQNGVARIDYPGRIVETRPRFFATDPHWQRRY